MNQEVTAGAVVVNILVLGIFGIGISNWVRAIISWRRGVSILPWEPRRRAPWGLFDLLVALVLVFLGAMIAVSVIRAFGWLPGKVDFAKLESNQRALLIFADGASRLLVMPILLGLIALRTGATAKDLGFDRTKVWSDIKLGAAAFTMLLPIITLIQLVLTRWQKYEHELLEVLSDLPGWQWALAMAFVAGVSAPIAEEILFRLILQGWIEKLFGFRGPTHELILGPLRGYRAAHRPHPGTIPVASELGSPVAAPKQAPFATDPNPDASPRDIQPESTFPHPPVDTPPDEESVPPELRRHGWIAIAISSLIFALLHWSHGPAWVALTVLAAGMGFLYQRTHRLLPSLVVHAMLNNMTLLLVFLSPEAAKA